jgi:hypothetical protein
MVTAKQLQAAVDLLNTTAGTPTEYGLPGNFHTDSAYNRWGLMQIVEGGGAKRIIEGTNRGDLFDKIHLLRAGILYGARNHTKVEP